MVAGLPWYISRSTLVCHACFFVGEILALLWIPDKMPQQQRKVVLAFVEWVLLIMFSNVL